ncbi:MAG: alpha/beta hydrolase, partial [Marinoscillum sp.]
NTMTILNIPGWKNSKEGHWQTIWEANDPSVFIRIEQSNWTHPKKEEWIPVIASEIQQYKSPILITAHSIGVMAFVHAAIAYQLKVKGAFLVAPSDPEQAGYPKEIEGFAPVPLKHLPFPTIVISSDNDPAVSLVRAKYFADQWGSDFYEVNGAGHFRPVDGYGKWPYGLELLEELW